jgi:2-polyprenyl-6-methoxyphenol hydroxylase-like FAD-dependent oxidoreductase
MYADLVVDATGRGSRAPMWLEQLGYRRPPEERVEIGLGYATRAFRLRPGALGSDVLVIHGGTPANTRGGFLTAIEGGRHMVTLAGILGDHPPTDLAGFRAFAESLIFADIAEALVGAEPLDDGVSSRFPVSVRRRYEQLRELPTRMLAIGDAVCSFNPVYGQGMTAASLHASALSAYLHGGPRLDEPATGYFRAVRVVVDAAWQTSTTADLALPHIDGPYPPGYRLVAGLANLIFMTSADDWELNQRLSMVTTMLAHPNSLAQPGVLFRTALARMRRRDPATS